MLSTIETINQVVNDFIWGVPAMVCIIGVGFYLSCRTGFFADPQVLLCHPDYHRKDVPQEKCF